MSEQAETLERNHKIEINRVMPASAEEVFDAWLDAESLKAWFCPGENVHVPDPVVNAKVGGDFDFTMKVENRLLPHHGAYKVIERPTTLQFTWISAGTDNLETIVTINIEAINDQESKLTLIHELLQDEESRDDHNGGWTRIIDCLHEVLSKR